MKPTGTQVVAVSALSHSLRAMRLCAPGEQQSLERSLARLGQLAPLLVFVEGDGLEVIDGFKRLEAARNLGWAEISVVPLEVTRTGAKVRLWQSNAGTNLSELEEAWLVQSLHREDKLTQVQIGQLFGRHKSWVSRRLLLVESLCEEVQAAVRLGLLGATSARELGRLPRGNQAEVAQMVTQRGLTTRQTAGLVHGILSARDSESRPEILAENLSRQASGPKARSQSKRTPAEWILSDVASIRRTCGRLQARLLERSLASLGPESAERCAIALRELQGVLSALKHTVERAVQNEVCRGNHA